jgi:hypothetical protein
VNIALQQFEKEPNKFLHYLKVLQYRQIVERHYYVILYILSREIFSSLDLVSELRMR